MIDGVRVTGSVKLDDVGGNKIWGLITFNRQHRWRFTASNLLNKDLPFYAIFQKIGYRWRDAIALPKREDGFRERYPITKILSQMLIKAFGRQESAFDGQPLALIESALMCTTEGSSSEMIILVLPLSSVN